jgi:F0F1-type ATP synthase membrane subunit c/vacuolar-type H+-ATPase subunit K
MRYWAVLIFSMTLASAADNALYDGLKTASPLPSQQTESHDFSLEQTPILGDNNISIGVQKDYDPVFINVNEELPTRYRTVIEDSLYLQLIMLSSIGILAIMPEDITNWNAAKLEEKSLSQRWKDHVTTKPIWDNDSWVINYIGHPVSGAWYYTMGRNDGLSIGESAALSALMSTFIWEYGYEAFAEVPSIQDLIVTPLFGSILGEGMYILEGKLDQQGGRVFGSKSLGNVSYFFLDPLGQIADGMKNALLFFRIDLDVTMSIQTYPQFRVIPHHLTGEPTDSILYSDREIGFIITFR